MKAMIDTEAARELELYTVNTGDLYRRMVCPAIDNLRRKAKKGQYDAEKAAKLFGYTADEAAKMYAREFCENGARYYNIFNAATRREVAKRLEEYYREDVFYGINP